MARDARRCAGSLLALVTLVPPIWVQTANAAEPLDLTVAPSTAASPGSSGDSSGGIETAIGSYFDAWSERVAYARSTQPGWSSPLVTTTALLEQRVRFDASFQTVGNGSSNVNLGGGRGLDLIVGDTQEIQIADDPYIFHETPSGKGEYTGFADWPAFRFKQRLASSPESEGDYVVSAWLQVQVPVGIAQLTNHVVTLLPTLGFGKGWGPIVVQGTVGAVIPTADQSKLGTQLVTNMALQYHLLEVLWPQIEVNWTYYADGQRGGLNQVFLTPGIVVGRLALTDRLKFTFGVGYQTALAPDYRQSPLTPAYNHAWLTTARMSF